MIKNLFNLTVEELESISNTGSAPFEISLEGIEKRSDLEKLYKFRNNIKRLAKIILKTDHPAPPPPIKPPKEPKPRQAQIVNYKGVSHEIKQQRLDLKREELDLKKQKQTTNTLMWENIQDIKRNTISLQKDMENIQTILKGIYHELQALRAADSNK